MDKELFGFYKLNEKGMVATKEISDHFDDLLRKCCKTVFGDQADAIMAGSAPADGARQWALLKTKLEEACFFAKKTSSIQKEHQG